MNNTLTTISKAEKALLEAKTPEESKNIEAVAAAARAWAKEQGNYEGVVYAGKIYLKSRRKTTELIVPYINPPGNPQISNYDSDVTIADFGLTQKQWSRRRKELEEITEEDIEDYIDDCIEKGIEPTVAGLLRYATEIIPESTGNEWWTPKAYIDSVREVLGEIDLDPASCEEANQIVQAKLFYTEEEDGLTKPWNGKLFMNPPYSANKPFAEKMLSEYSQGNVEEAIILLGAHAIETKWFAHYWNYVLCFTGHRIKFNTPTGQAKAGNIAGSVFIHLGGGDDYKFAEEFVKHGYVVKRWPE